MGQGRVEHPRWVLASLIAAACHEDRKLREAYEHHRIESYFRRPPASADPLEVLADAIVFFSTDRAGKFNGFADPIFLIPAYLEQHGVVVRETLIRDIADLKDKGLLTTKNLLTVLRVSAPV